MLTRSLFILAALLSFAFFACSPNAPKSQFAHEFNPQREALGLEKVGENWLVHYDVEKGILTCTNPDSIPCLKFKTCSVTDSLIFQEEDVYISDHEIVVNANPTPEQEENPEIYDPPTAAVYISVLYTYILEDTAYKIFNVEIISNINGTDEKISHPEATGIMAAWSIIPPPILVEAEVPNGGVEPENTDNGIIPDPDTIFENDLPY